MIEDRLLFVRITSKNINEAKAILDKMVVNNTYTLKEDVVFTKDFILSPKYQKEYFNFIIEGSEKYGYSKNEVCHIVVKDKIVKYISKNIKKLDNFIDKTDKDNNIIIEVNKNKETLNALNVFIEKTKKSDLFLVISV